MDNKKLYNLDAEKTLVNQMIINSSIIPNVYDTVKPETFYAQSYKSCYEIILSLYSQSKPVDEVVFRSESEKRIGLKVIDDVTNATFTAANWEYYADIVKNCYTARSVFNMLQKALAELNEKNGDDIANFILGEAGKIASNISACEIHNTEELATAFIKKLDEACTQNREYTGISTGLKNLDDITLGLQPEYIVIGARPSLGKTALGEQIALHTAGVFSENPSNTGIKTAFIELEMSPIQLTERAISNLARVPINRLRTGFLSQNQLNTAALKTRQFAYASNFIPVTCNTRKLSDICSCIRRLVRTDGVKIVFIDHIGLIHPNGNYKSSWEGVREISNTIQQLQRELLIPIVVLSQVGREVEGKKPSLADLRGSGAIEEDADTIMFIERDRQQDLSETCIPTVINIQKNRNGACGSAKLNFLPQEVMFVDVKEEKGEVDKINVCDRKKSDYEDFLG